MSDGNTLQERLGEQLGKKRGIKGTLENIYNFKPLGDQPVKRFLTGPKREDALTFDETPTALEDTWIEFLYNELGQKAKDRRALDDTDRQQLTALAAWKAGTLTDTDKLGLRVIGFNRQHEERIAKGLANDDDGDWAAFVSETGAFQKSAESEAKRLGVSIDLATGAVSEELPADADLAQQYLDEQQELVRQQAERDQIDFWRGGVLDLAGTLPQAQRGQFIASLLQDVRFRNLFLPSDSVFAGFGGSAGGQSVSQSAQGPSNNLFDMLRSEGVK